MNSAYTKAIDEYAMATQCREGQQTWDDGGGRREREEKGRTRKRTRMQKYER